MMVAAIDCGTNTIKLLIGDLPAISVVETRIVRLGQGVDRTGRLADEALARTFAAIDEYAALIAAHPVERIRFCATSATRDASNSEAFTEGVLARLGVTPEVISGEEEAALAFDGAIRHLRVPAAPPLFVVDIGGGSTELILGADEPTAAFSMDIGSVRLHERHLHSDPPTAEEVAAATADIEAALDACPVSPADAATVVGIAGTVCTVAAGVLDLPAYDKSRIDQAVLPVSAVHDYVGRLVAMTVEQRLALPYMHPGRADVIGAGALVLSRVLARTTVPDIIASESDILHGIAWSMSR
jgi:exopolyphosphatase / guanosine-5'-triphosphate,3'-diphosphate pyrophosphatase